MHSVLMHWQSLREEGRALSLLYVEDDPSTRAEYVRFLKRIFNQVDAATDATEALARYRTHPYDLVVTDIEMPDMDGISMLGMMKKHNPELRCIILSAHEKRIYLRQSIDVGVDAYILKPIHLDEMAVALRKCVGHINHARDKAHHTQRLEAQINAKRQELIKMYTTDDLTGFFNLAKLEHDLQSPMTRSLLLLKINNFKKFNDSYGYEVGDLLLGSCAALIERTLTSLKHPPICYRTSGSHFALLSYEPLKYFEITARMLLDTFEQEAVEIDGKSTYLEINAGLVSGEGTQLLSHADSALRLAVRQKRELIVIDSEHDGLHRSDKLFIERQNMIKNALLHNRFVIYYQPIMCHENRLIDKYEALLRLQNDQGAIVAPIEFLHVAYESQLYSKIVQQIIPAILRDFRESECSVSINISLRDILNASTRHMILDAVINFQEPSRLVFELIETEGIDSYETVSSFFSELKRLGSRIAIDDFGTGYSNFEYLCTLPIDYIKIDGSLVKKILTDANAASVVKLLCEFAHSSGIKIIAEHVSSGDLLYRLHAMGVDASQGYHIGKPAPFSPSLLHACKFG